MAYVVFILTILAFSLFAFYITRKEKRSFQSWGSEKLLRLRLKKGWFHAAEDSSAFLIEQSVLNEQPYVLPAPLNVLAVIERSMIAGNDCVILRERGRIRNTQILYVHGGAYVEHPILPHWFFLDRINNHVQGTITVPIYPKAPVHTVSEVFNKLIDLYCSITQENSPAHTILMGDSAGGGLALSLSQELLLRGIPLPKELILISPWLDISLRNANIQNLESKDPMLNRKHLQMMGQAWAGDVSVHDKKVSPINGPLQGLPPISLFVGTHEIFLPDAQKFKTLCARQGVQLSYFEYAKMNHDFPLFPIPEARSAVREIVGIINRK